MAKPELKSFTVDLLDQRDHQPLLTGSPQTCGMRSGRVWLAPGQDCGTHTTGQHEEALVFLSGNGQALIDGQTIPVGQGKIAYIPPHTEHNIANNQQDAPLVYIYCVAPAKQKE